MIPRQETFNRMVAHLDKQVAQFGTQKTCKYRTQLPTKLGQMCEYRCPVGALLPDELYQPCLEFALTTTAVAANETYGHTAVVRDSQILLQAHIASLGHDVLLCRAVQCVHDYNAAHQWYPKLRDVATYFSLDMPRCDQLLSLHRASLECSSTTTA